MSADSIVAARTWSGGSDDSDDSVVPLFVKITSVPGRAREEERLVRHHKHYKVKITRRVTQLTILVGSTPSNTCGTVITFTSEH